MKNKMVGYITFHVKSETVSRNLIFGKNISIRKYWVITGKKGVLRNYFLFAPFIDKNLEFILILIISKLDIYLTNTQFDAQPNIKMN